MAESAYHMEALRRQRVIERKRAALNKMVNGGNQDSAENVNQTSSKNPILFTGPGDYDTNRIVLPAHRIFHRKADNTPEDKVFPLLHPQEYEPEKPITQLPPRKPHFKV
ncbi:uncharacterized protein LOC111118737 isoform X8 [Crassostrea virginica]|uniref:Uncharacterized protein LOC111118737 isoform X6 n=1 Tax=Crassostrea virginica TaxID=6565 RepID=A0A8B8CED2_CRAVI|nr:uncharacterized protein LOC111118737 isoform X6 [Crassostrea virginica]XP_022317631.1 uncharacterized protein LOC111120898 isoform X6 [Crassostrea virginica]